MDDKPPSDVGEKLKALRKRYGLSQRQLAEKAGLTHGTVSFIERNKISPSIGTLRQILDSISMTLSDFFSDNQEGENDFFYSREELLEVGTGGVSLLQIGKTLTDCHCKYFWSATHPEQKPQVRPTAAGPEKRAASLLREKLNSR